jgi:hypothetical protein
MVVSSLENGHPFLLRIAAKSRRINKFMLKYVNPRPKGDLPALKL